MAPEFLDFDSGFPWDWKEIVSMKLNNFDGSNQRSMLYSSDTTDLIQTAPLNSGLVTPHIIPIAQNGKVPKLKASSSDDSCATLEAENAFDTKKNFAVNPSSSILI